MMRLAERCVHVPASVSFVSHPRGNAVAGDRPAGVAQPPYPALRVPTPAAAALRGAVGRHSRPTTGPRRAGCGGGVQRMTAMRVVPATADRWPEIGRIFGPRETDPTSCWCQRFLR